MGKANLIGTMAQAFPDASNAPPYYTFFRLEGSQVSKENVSKRNLVHLPGDEQKKEIGDSHGEEALGDPMNTKAIYDTIESSCYYYSIS